MQGWMVQVVVKPLLGDMLIIGGTLFYAMSNIGEELCVKKRDRVEVVALLGVFGLIVSICEISIFEISALKATQWDTELILLLATFGLSTFIFYTIVPFALKVYLMGHSSVVDGLSRWHISDLFDDGKHLLSISG